MHGTAVHGQFIMQAYLLNISSAQAPCLPSNRLIVVFGGGVNQKDLDATCATAQTDLYSLCIIIAHADMQQCLFTVAHPVSDVGWQAPARDWPEYHKRQLSPLTIYDDYLRNGWYDTSPRSTWVAQPGQTQTKGMKNGNAMCVKISRGVSKMFSSQNLMMHSIQTVLARMSETSHLSICPIPSYSTYSSAACIQFRQSNKGQKQKGDNWTFPQ